MGPFLALALIDGLVQGYDSFDDGGDRDWTRPLGPSTVVTVPLPAGATKLGLHVRDRAALGSPALQCDGRTLDAGADGRYDVVGCATPVEIRFPQRRSDAQLDALWAWTDAAGPGCGEADRAAALAALVAPTLAPALRVDGVGEALLFALEAELAAGRALVATGTAVRVPNGEAPFVLANTRKLPGVRRGAPVLAWGPAGDCAWTDHTADPQRLVSAQQVAEARSGWRDAVSRGYDGWRLSLDAELEARLRPDGAGWALQRAPEAWDEPAGGLPWPVPARRRLGNPWPAQAQALADELWAAGAAVAETWRDLEAGPVVVVDAPEGLASPARAGPHADGRRVLSASGEILAWHEAGRWGAATGLGETQTWSVLERGADGAPRAYTVLHHTRGAWWGEDEPERDDTWQVERTVPSGSGFLRTELMIPVEGPVSAARLETRWFQAPPPAGAPPRR